MSLEKVSGKLVKGGSDFSLSDEEYVGFYFSAHWCPPCRGFTPVLAEFYQKVKANKDKFEIVFISSDRDEAAFNEYFAEMPWATLKFSERDLKQELSQTYGISGIPSLIILDKAGNLVTKDGRGKVMQKQQEEKPSAVDWK